MTEAIASNDIKNFNNDGVIVLRGIFKDWIEVLKRGAEFHINNPSDSALIHRHDSYQGHFMEDFCNWQRIAEYKDFVLNSPLGSFAADLTGSKSIQFFHDHFFYKEASSGVATPWHQDMPYYCVDGNDTGSFWIPLDPISKDNSLQILLGSHKFPKLVRPNKWSNNQPWYKNDDNFMDMPDIKSMEKNILKPKMNLGDAILFNFKVLHSSSGNSENIPRRAFSIRFIGDDVKYIDRGEETSPPFKGIDLKNGAKMREDWFPVVWSN